MSLFEPDQLAEIAERAKEQLRQRLRALRGAHPADALAVRSEAIASRVVASPAFESARSVGLFFPLLERKEVDLRGVDAAARRAGKRVYYPFLTPQDGKWLTGFRATQALTDLELRGQRFFEPSPEAPVAERGDIDLLLVPALGVAASGHRLGYGGGFYDATLPDFRPPARALVVAYDFQLLAELPVLPHDVACDGVVTDARFFDAGAPR